MQKRMQDLTGRGGADPEDWSFLGYNLKRNFVPPSCSRGIFFFIVQVPPEKAQGASNLLLTVSGLAPIS